MARLFANNAASTLLSAITNVATSLTLASGAGALFPSPTGGDFFELTLTQAGSTETSWEIVQVTARAGDVLTVVRGYAGTTAAAWGAGAKAELRVTADLLALLFGAVMDVGTRMAFQQTAAPTGWTKDTTAAINDSILRLSTGVVTTGGSLAFSTWAAQTSDGAVTLSIAQIPSHDHNAPNFIGPSCGSSTLSDVANYGYTAGPNSPAWPGQVGVKPQGGGGSHAHSLSQALKYYDFIIASKN